MSDAKDVVCLSKDKKKNVPVAEAQQPSEAPSEPAVAAPAEPKSFSDLLKGVPADKIEVAESFGIPVRQIAAWADSVEARFAQVEAGFEKVGVVLEKIEPLAQMVQQAQSQPQQPAGQGGGIPIGQILQLLGAGGASTDPTIQYLAEIGRETIGLGHFVFKEVIKKAIPEAIESWERSQKAQGEPKT